MRSWISIGVLAALLLGLPGGARTHAEVEAQTVIKVATMAPRTDNVVMEERKWNQKLMEQTNGRIQFRTYYGGTAGDEKDVLRKIRAGQIDAAPLGAQTVAAFVRQAMILMAPRTFYNYKQVDAVRADLEKDFGDEAYKNGFKIISWWDAGKVRIFSKRPVQTFADLRTGRPWLYPESPLLREFYKMIQVTGVPLGLNEVYGGLQTDMIDTVWISSVLAMAFRWHSNTKFISPPVSIIQGAFSISRKTWDKLSADDQKAILDLNVANVGRFQKEFREADEKTFKRFLQRGFTLMPFKENNLWEAKGKELRDKMVGRIYDAALLKRVEAITSKYNDEPTDMVGGSLAAR